MTWNNLYKIRAWVVCLSAALFFFYEFLQINMFGAITPHLKEEFNTNSTIVGLLSASYLLGNILILPAGLLLDFISPRKIILIAMSISVIGTFLFSLSYSIETALVSRFIAGVSAGPFCFLSVIKLISQWFKIEKTAFVTGVVVALAMVAGIISQAPFVWMISIYGWRKLLLFNSVLGSCFIFWIYFFVYDYKKVKFSSYEYLKKNAVKIFYDVKKVISYRQNWFCGSCASLINLPIFIVGATWGCTYLSSVHNLTYKNASIVTTMLYIGMLIGSPLFGYFSDSIKKRRLPILIGSLIYLAASMFIMIEECSFIMLLPLFFLLGLGSSAQIIVYPTVSESNTVELTGTSVGLATTLIMFGGGVFQSLFGIILDFYKNETNNYHNAFLILPITAGLSIILAWNIQETYCKRLQ